MRVKHLTLLAALIAYSFLNSTPASAGCGCEKPPPLPAAVRPHATYAGSHVTLFHPALVDGANYDVSFVSAEEVATVQGTASVGRDLADGSEKVQLAVGLPPLPPGPAAIEIVAVDTGSIVSSLTDDHFTVVADPIAIPDEYGEYVHSDVRAAVGRDGLVYLALDMSGLQRPTIFEAQAIGLPLRFDEHDVVFYNTQGVLMQALVDQDVEPVPGMFVLPALDAANDSDVLHYSRHEFASYFLGHEERAPHAVDENDPNWHLDGSRHIDHNHLILAIDGAFENGDPPAPGATESFDLRLAAHSLFRSGLVGHATMTIRDDAKTDSYDPETRTSASNGDIYSNGRIDVVGRAVVAGDASGAQINLKQKAQILGDTYLVTEPISFMSIQTPQGIEDLGDLTIGVGETFRIDGPGSFQVGDLYLYSGAQLVIDNAAGPVTLYVSGVIEMWANSIVETASVDPEQFAIYATSGESISMWANGGGFYGVVYAPYSQMKLMSGQFFGAFVAAEAIASGDTQVHYDETLRSSIAGALVPVEYAPVADSAGTSKSSTSIDEGSAAPDTSATTLKTGKGNLRKITQ